MSSIHPYLPMPNTRPPLAHTARLASIMCLAWSHLISKPDRTAPTSSPELWMLTIHEYHVSLRPSPGWIWWEQSAVEQTLLNPINFTTAV